MMLVMDKKTMGKLLRGSETAWKRASKTFPEIKGYDKDAFTMGYVMGIKDVFTFLRGFHCVPRKGGQPKRAKGKKK
jgi:hypothetical protein